MRNIIILLLALLIWLAHIIAASIQPPAGQGAQPVPTPRNCATAIARGLDQTAAAQYPHLDRDHDGVACYGD